MDLTPYEASLWWMTIAISFGVVLVVVLLLSFLVAFVKIIDREVVNVRDTLRTITGNTADTKLIPATAGGVEAVLAEGLQHHLFLGRVIEKV